MTSTLEALPSDILQHIALQTTNGSYSPSGTLHGISPLLLASSTLYRNLCMESCPHLYADIFRRLFDTRAFLRRFKFQVTDSALASELVVRCEMLQRVRRRSILPSELRKDLWTAFWMIQESDGLNELHLRGAGLPEFLLEILNNWAENGERPTHEFHSLVIWLLCFTLTQQHILSLPPGVKATLQAYLLPFSRNVHEHAGSTQAINRSASTHLSRTIASRDRLRETNATRGPQLTHVEYSTKEQRYRDYEDKMGPVDMYGRGWDPSCPDPTLAAINLLFCLREIDSLAVPEHLPETRAIAIATQRTGPTKEDFLKIRGYKTKLFADTLPSAGYPQNYTIQGYGSRSGGMDLEFSRMVLGEGGVKEVKALSLMCGMLAGVWEGFYMFTATQPGIIGHERQHHTTPDFICRKPLQSVFTEYVCFADQAPNFPVEDDSSGVRNIPKLCLETEAGFELDGRKYERLVVDSDPRQPHRRGREAREPVDIVLLGKTLEEHEQAWGGFKFAGRVRRDGSIILKREAKEGGGEGLSAGTWIFEGRVCFGELFAGTCSPNSSVTNNTSAMRGIFSMQKRAKDFTSW
ncbi:hypothetical protein AN958_01714 [Leucoagaricus sp. SymC.cos]|nr:hypothetical protein AN958_01714 [Leucoagaricus sp. SymC.cos]